MMLDKFDDYLRNEKKFSVHTLTSYIKDVSSFMEYAEEVFEITKPNDITYVVIREWIVFLTESSISPRSVNRKLSSLRKYFSFLRKENFLKEDPLLKHKSLKVSKKIHPPVAEEEVAEVLQYIDEVEDFESLRDLLLIELLYTTGIRRNELLTLKETDVSMTENLIKVTGKRNKQRIIPLLNVVVSHLNKYMKMKQERFGAYTSSLFVTNKGKELYPNFIYRVVTYHLSKVSSKQKISPHILRHAFATHLLSNGAELNSVKELLGHASLSSTQIYTHNNIGMLKNTYLNAHPRSK